MPEDRVRPVGRTIGPRVVGVPSLVKPARRDAFTYLAGGPGGVAASELVSSALAIRPGVHERHDILLVDLRGTGGSNPLQCPPPAKPLATDAQRQQCARASLKGDPPRTLVGRYGCLGGLVAPLLDRGTVQGLDTTCARDIPVPPFVLR